MRKPTYLSRFWCRLCKTTREGEVEDLPIYQGAITQCYSCGSHTLWTDVKDGTFTGYAVMSA